MSADPAGYAVASLAPATQREGLEWLLFFNPAQHVAQASILAEIARLGHPRIVESRAGLTVQVGEVPCQTLFAFSRAESGDRPIALLVFRRESHEELAIVHLAVAPQHSYSHRGGRGAALVLVEAVRRVASSIAGIERIRLAYRNLSIRRARF